MTTNITIDNVTSGSIDGNGSFDIIMKTMALHLQEEYNSGRITGSDYATVYLGSIQSAMSQSIQFELSRPNSSAQTDNTLKTTELVEEQIRTQVNQTDNVLANTEVTRERGGFR